MARVLCVALLALAVAGGALAAYCNGKPNPDAKPNENPIWSGTPTLLKSIPNGRLYQVGEGEDVIPVVHIWGTAYEKGVAHGTLMKAQAADLMNSVWNYFQQQVIGAINGTGHSLHLPQWAIDLIADVGLEGALDIEYDLTKPFTRPDFYQEMQGLADAAGVDFKTIRRIHMIGELTKGSCSMYGAWGQATASLDGALLQLRALDWDTDGPFKNHPQITVYHGNGDDQTGYTWANIGWSGWIGSITGLSENQLGMSEIGVSYPDSDFGKEYREGIPFTNIIRDVLQFDTTIDAAKHRLSTSNRTCDLILGVGDGKQSGGFTGTAYSGSEIHFYSDTNNHPVGDWHPLIQNVVYYGMDWLCPSYTSVLGRQLQHYHGNITAENTIYNITAIVQTGDLHAAIYNLRDLSLHVANARADGEHGPRMAYDRQFSRIDMAAMFKVAQPSADEIHA